MNGVLINLNMRQRILACGGLNDFLSEKGELQVVMTDGTMESMDDCEWLGVYFKSASSVREKLQILSLCRVRRCPAYVMGSNERFGVVIEFGNEFGVDALAVYSDSQAAWYSGRDDSLTEVCLFPHENSAYQRLREAVGRGIQCCIPHPVQIPSPPPVGYTVISFLSQDGIAYAPSAPAVSRLLQSRRVIAVCPIIHPLTECSGRSVHHSRRPKSAAFFA